MARKKAFKPPVASTSWPPVRYKEYGNKCGWYVLASKDGYLGTQYMVKQNTITNPRAAVFPGLKAPLYATISVVFGLDAATAEATRGQAILGVKFDPLRVRIEGRGEKQSKIIPV
jgi:hypothetical protein